MHDVVLMAIVDARENLLNKESSVSFGEFTASENLFEEFSSLADLLYDVVALVVFKEFEHLYNVRMIELFENVYLVEEHASFVLVHVALSEDFNSSLCCGITMDTHSDFTEGSLPKNLADTIVVSKFSFVFLDRVLGTDCHFLFNHNSSCIS